MDAAGYKAKGNEFFAAKDFEAAIEQFSKAIELDAGNHVLYSNRSASYASLKKWAEAEADAQKCVELAPTWIKGYTRLGSAQHGAGKLDEAEATYTKGLEIEPGNASLQESRDALEGDRKRDQAGNMFGKAFGPDAVDRIRANPKLSPFLAQPDFLQMITMIQQNPQMAQAFLKDQRILQCFLELSGMGTMFNKAGEGADEAEAAPAPPPPQPAAAKKPEPKKEEAKTLSPAEKLKEEGNAFYKKREFDAAMAKYSAAIEMEPTNAVFRLNRSAVLFELEKYDECLAVCKEAEEIGIEHKADYKILVKLQTRQASCLQKQGKHDEAIELFKRALLEWRNPETLAKLEACEKEKKRLAEEAYLDPAESLRQKEQGNEFFKASKFPEAIKCYEEAIRRNPKDHALYSNKAASLLKLGAYEEAIKDCDACLAIKPDFVKAHARKGHAYFWTKQYYKAMQNYDDGLKIDPENAECIEGKQKTMMKMNEVANSEGDEEVARRAMSDPEILAITQDTYMQMVLGEIQRDPKRLQEYMKDPGISAKINKLVQAGILRFGGGGGQGGAAPGRR